MFNRTLFLQEIEKTSIILLKNLSLESHWEKGKIVCEYYFFLYIQNTNKMEIIKR